VKENGWHRRHDLVGPILLICLGIIVLLVNLGLLESTIWWTLLRLWPVILIALGIDLLIGRRSRLGALLAFLLILGLFAGMFWLVWSGALEGGVGRPRQEISYPLDDVDEANVTMETAVGELRVSSLGPGSDNLMEGLVGTQDVDLEREHSTVGSRATIRLVGSRSTGFPAFGDSSQEWRLMLNPDVAIDLEAQLGVGQTILELGDLDVTDLEVAMAVGQTRVTLPRNDLEGEIECAIGQVDISVPQDVGARISFDTGIVPRSLPGDYTCEEDVCTSPGYEGAEHQVELSVDLAIGSVRVR